MCDHYWLLTEDGYSRTWITEIEDDGTVIARDGEFSDDGSGEYLWCPDCGERKWIDPRLIIWN